MAVGIQMSRESVDSRAGNLAWMVFDALGKAHAYHERLTAIPDATLEALGYTAGEVAVIKSAFGDLDLLWQVFTGSAEVTPAKDFTTFAVQLIADTV